MKNKLTAMMFVLAMTSMFSAYSQESVDTLRPENEDYQIIKRIKTCIGIEDIYIIQSKSFDVMMAWIKDEAENENRSVTIRLNKETGVYIATSLSKENKGHQAIFDKIENCLKGKDVCIIETKNVEIFDAWLKEERKDVTIIISTYPPKDTEIGVYSAVSHARGVR